MGLNNTSTCLHHISSHIKTKGQANLVGKDIERFESFCHELHSTCDAVPVGCHENSITMPFRLRLAPPKNQPVLLSSERLVHAGNEGRDLLLTVAEVTSLDEMVKQNGGQLGL